MNCPACHQTISDTDGSLECGGEGEGICAFAAYAFDLQMGREPEWEFPDLPLPDADLCEAILDAFTI